MLKVSTLFKSQTDSINQMITIAKLTSVFENKKICFRGANLFVFKTAPFHFM
jgi:hypothetical protein